MGIADKLSAPGEWHRRLLRPRRERPHSRAAEKSDELAPFIKKTRSKRSYPCVSVRLRSAKDLPFSSSRVGRRPVGNVAVGTCVSSHAPRTEPYVRLSRIRLPPRVYDGESGRIRSSAFVTRAWLWVQYVLC